jgi:4-amino-4-deoxy-L-arabinose transferase
LPTPPDSRFDARFYAAAVLALLVIASLLIKLNHLDHASVKPLDESFHAVVARNLLKHPLTPTLYDQPYLPYDYRDWQSNHVWLHKPIVPLWQMAASMAALGTSTFALRLPSALLASASVLLTYAIGVELFRCRRIALIAAALHAFNPSITYLVHGYLFSDHIDVALLFWVELSIWLLLRGLREGSTRWLIAAGVAQGVAYLCKTYPAFIVALISLAAWRWWPQVKRRHIVTFLVSAAATILPWSIYCLIRFPREFQFEQLQVFRHLTHNVEQWAGPWDRVIFDFLLRIYNRFYPAVIVATILMLRAAWRERNSNLGLLLLWALGVLIPFTFATSKTPSATLMSWPAFYLLLAVMIVRAVDGDALCLGGWVASVVLAFLAAGKIPSQGWGYPNPPRFAGVMRENIWVLWHVLAAFAAAVALYAILCHRARINARRVTLPLVIIAALASTYLLYRLVKLNVIAAAENRSRPSFPQLAELSRTQLPPNAVLLLENNEKLEHMAATFYTGRSVYPVSPETWRETADKIEKAGGVPLLATRRNVDLTRALTEQVDGLNLYAVGTAPPPR